MRSEKAHEDLINVLLQVFDGAVLTDNSGAKIDFRNVIIIMTSNLGTKEGVSVGFTSNTIDKTSKAIKDLFSPEFINRIDEIVILLNACRDECYQRISVPKAKLKEFKNEAN